MGKKYIATMVAGPESDYPTKTITVFEPRPADAPPRARRKPYVFRHGESHEVSEQLAERLRTKRQPVKRGPCMFHIADLGESEPAKIWAEPAAEPVVEPDPEPSRAPEEKKPKKRGRKKATGSTTAKKTTRRSKKKTDEG